MSKKRTMRRVSSIHAPVMLFLLAVSLLAGCGAEGDGILDQKAETEGITVPVLISPADGSSFMDTTPDFDWNDVSGATGYRVQISTVNDFSATVTDQQTPSSSFSFSGRALSPGNYYWRVMAHNGASGASEWSDAFTFSVARSGTAIIPPVLQSPANGGITEDTTPDFDWEDAAGATGYQLQAAGSPEFISPSVDVMMSASNYAFSATPLGLGTYYWRVRAQSGPEKWSEWSSPFSFTIVSTSVDTQPQAVILQPSGDRTIFVGGSVDFAGAVTGGDGQITYTWDFGDARTSDVLDPPPITFGTPGRYTIQFNAVDTDGDQSTSRIIITATDDAPVLMEPDNGYASTSGTIAFSWGMVDAAASYILSLESNGSPSSYTATAAAYTVTGLSSGDYTWSVCAVDSLGNRGRESSQRSFTVSPSSPSTWYRVWAGHSHTLGIRESDRSLWAWGSSAQCRLGAGSGVEYSTVPLRIGDPGARWKYICADDHMSFAIQEDGSLWAWGQNMYGSLGLGDGYLDTVQCIPVRVEYPSKNWVMVDCGYGHAAALSEEGELYVWGDNSEGQLGDNRTEAYRTIPERLGADLWRTVGTGGNYVLAVRYDGTLWGWGQNRGGELGDESDISKDFPVQILTGSGIEDNWQSVSAGYYHSVAIKGGELWGTGSNGRGQLGGEPYDRRLSFGKLLDDTGFTTAAAGYFTTFALKTDGSYWGMGENESGQMGYGDTITRRPFELLDAADSWVQVSAGDTHTMLLRSDGSLFGTGDNQDGKLGDGTGINRSSPVMITIP